MIENLIYLLAGGVMIAIIDYRMGKNKMQEHEFISKIADERLQRIIQMQRQIEGEGLVRKKLNLDISILESVCKTEKEERQKILDTSFKISEELEASKSANKLLNDAIKKLKTKHAK